MRDARLTILGSGTSSGVPAIGCACRVCTSSDPRDRRWRTAGALEFVDGAGQPRCILLDCGPDHREQALRFKLTRADEILVTHAHVDHVWGLDETRRYNVLQGGSIRLAADAASLRSLRQAYPHILGGDRGPNGSDSWVADLIPREIAAGETFESHGLRITAVELMHGRMPVLGFVMEPAHGCNGSPLFPLAWCTDVSCIPPAAAERLTGVKTLVLDALRDRPHPTHFTIEAAIAASRALGAARTVLVHLAHDLTHEELLGRLPPGIEPGYDGLVIG